jgi:DnaJ-class molecular chaperone
MTYQEIIEDRKIELIHAPSGQKCAELGGKDVTKQNIYSVMFYNLPNGKRTYSAWSVENISFDQVFFYLVRKGKIEIPSDYDTCHKCSGTGNVGYNVDGGRCWKCEGFGYIRH